MSGAERKWRRRQPSQRSGAPDILRPAGLSPSAAGGLQSLECDNQQQAGGEGEAAPTGGNDGGCGYLHLRGDWYYTSARPGDVVHLVSLSGSFRTDPPSLPAVLHTDPPPGS
ncbi:hypothetical protein THAOC_27658, partial [Thalassiosira oceanica]